MSEYIKKGDLVKVFKVDENRQFEGLGQVTEINNYFYEIRTIRNDNKPNYNIVRSANYVKLDYYTIFIRKYLNENNK